MDDATLSFAVLGAVVVLFVWNRLPVELVAVGAALALYATGVVDVNEAVAGFGDPMVIFIAALFVVSDGLQATGVTARAGEWLIALAGRGGGAVVRRGRGAGGPVGVVLLETARNTAARARPATPGRGGCRSGTR